MSAQAVVPIQLPPGAPDWGQALADTLTALRQDLVAVRQDLATNTGKVDALVNDFQDLKKDVEELKHSSSSERMLALMTNGSCTRNDSPLVRVPHKKTGEYPPATANTTANPPVNAIEFPATYGGKYCKF